MKEVFVIKGRKVKVEGLGDRESKREFAEKFIKYKEDVERFLGFDEEKALSEVRTKGIDPESHYTIRIIFSPYFPLAKFYWDTEEFAFIFNLFQSSRIHEDIFYHEISHYFLTLNCIRLIDKHVKENLSSKEFAPDSFVFEIEYGDIKLITDINNRQNSHITRGVTVTSPNSTLSNPVPGKLYSMNFKKGNPKSIITSPSLNLPLIHKVREIANKTITTINTSTYVKLILDPVHKTTGAINKAVNTRPAK